MAYGIVLALNFYLRTVSYNSFIPDLAKLSMPGIKNHGLRGQTNVGLATDLRIWLWIHNISLLSLRFFPCEMGTLCPYYLSNHVQTWSYIRRILILLVTHRYTQSPEDGANLSLLFLLSHCQPLQRVCPSPIPHLQVPLPWSTSIFFPHLCRISLAIFIVQLLEDNWSLSNTAHSTKHIFVCIYVLRPPSFQRKGWRGMKGMEIPEKHTCLTLSVNNNSLFISLLWEWTKIILEKWWHCAWSVATIEKWQLSLLLLLHICRWVKLVPEPALATGASPTRRNNVWDCPETKYGVLVWNSLLAGCGWNRSQWK